MAQARGQTLAQMAFALVLRHGGVTTALIGASRPEQVVDCCGAIGNPEFTKAELAQINQITEQKDVNLQTKSAGLDCHVPQALPCRGRPAGMAGPGRRRRKIVLSAA